MNDDHGMTPDRHCEHILDRFNEEFRKKYRRGQLEHGGELWSRPELIDWAIEEAIDMVAFLYTLRDQLEVMYASQPSSSSEDSSSLPSSPPILDKSLCTTLKGPPSSGA